MRNVVKVRIYPDTQQQAALSQAFGCARWFWNYSLNLNNVTYKETGKGLSRQAYNDKLPELKKEFPWLAECYSQVLQSVSLNLSRASLTLLMMHLPHPDAQPIAVNCAVITVSDTRLPETDRSGQLAQQLLQAAGHSIADYFLIKDEPMQIQTYLRLLSQQSDLDAIVLNGGTGIAPRDTTYDAIEQLLDKTLPGFGELFRWLSYSEIGSRAMASRAIAGVFQGKLIFSVPGSSNAVRLALEKLILPELTHLVRQLNPDR